MLRFEVGSPGNGRSKDFTKCGMLIVILSGIFNPLSELSISFLKRGGINFLNLNKELNIVL